MEPGARWDGDTIPDDYPAILDPHVWRSLPIDAPPGVLCCVCDRPVIGFNYQYGEPAMGLAHGMGLAFVHTGCASVPREAVS